MKQLLLLLGCLWAVQVQAVPVVFSTSQFNTSTSASVGSVSDADSASSPPTALPLVTSSSALGLALSTAFADTGLLSLASTLIGSLGLPSAAAGTSEFIGTFFAVPGSLDLVLNLSSVVNGGTGGNLLHLLLVSGSVTLLDELFSTTQTITRDVDIVTGALTTLQLTLSSQASLPGVGVAARSANLEFDVDATPRTPTLPEPGTLLLLAIALTLMALSRRRSIAIRQAS